AGGLLLRAFLAARAERADPMDRLGLYGEIGRLHEERGADAGLAFHAWSRAFAAEPADDDARGEVDRLAGQLGAWDEHVAAYEVAASRTDDPDTQARLLHTVAQTHDQRRGDPRAAIETYERLVSEQPGDTAALDALEGLHTMVGDWRGLVDVLGRKVEGSYDPVDRAELLRRSASVQEELLGDPEGAITAYQRAAEEDPDDALALESLDRLFSSGSRSNDLRDVLAKRFEVETDEGTRVEVGLRLGALVETQLNEPNEAIDAFVRVLELAPTQPDAVASLGRLYERQALWSEFLDNVQLRASMATQASERVSLVHRAGEVYERELDDVHEAIVQYEQALELDSRHEPSLAALIRISHLEDYRQQTSEILEPLLHVQERWPELAELFRMRAEAASDPYDKKADFLRLAEVEENGRRDLDAAFVATTRAFAEDPSDNAIAEKLEQLAAATDGHVRLADELTARARAAHDPQVSRDLHWRVARIAEDHLQDSERAIAAYQAAIEQLGDDEEALAALDRLFAGQERHSDLADVIERRIALSMDEAARTSLQLRLGELRETHFGDLRGAFAVYQEVVEREPGDERATAALERLGQNDELARDVLDVLEDAYRQTGALERVAGLFMRRVELADTEGERIQMLQDAARLWEDELGRRDEAFGALRLAAELDPTDDAMLDELERLSEGERERLRGFVESIAEEGGADGRVLRDLHLRAARWYRELGDAAAAETQLRAALAIDGEALEVHESLVELLREQGRQEELAPALERFAAADSDEFNRRERLREAARLYESAVGDRAAAIRAYEAVRESDPTDEGALEELTRLREEGDEWTEVRVLLERRIELLMDPSERVRLRRQLAVVCQERLEHDDAATRAWEGVLDEEPEDLEAIGKLEPLYEASERWDDLRGLLDRRLDIATTDAERISARVRLARLSERAFGRRDDALEQLRGVLEIDPVNAEALDELERLLTLEEDWEALIDLLEGRASRAYEAGDWSAQRGVLE
ncbi:MAG: tetratricopeptide repeat protein, partial [Myxococcota bacterium]